MRRRTALVVAGVCVAGGVAAYARWARPWMATWGATDAEVAARQTADDLVVPDVTTTTRAITIDAPTREVWRWLVQIGEDRAGFYSYSWLERLALTDMRNADEVCEDWQRRQRGDTVWLAQRWGEIGRQVAAVVDPEEALVMMSPPEFAKVERGGLASGYWGFFLEPIDQSHTRLVARSSGGAVGTVCFDLVHFVMEQKMMRGIKQRAEHAVGHHG
jgi:hypothetical protein